MKMRVLLFCAAVALLLMLALSGFVGATGTAYSLVGLGNGTCTGVCTTSATAVLTITGDSVTIVHTGVQDDATTASASGDYIVIMNSYDSAGAAVSMVASYAPGKKLIVPAGASWVISGQDVPVGAGGRTIQILGVGHGATFTAKREQ